MKRKNKKFQYTSIITGIVLMLISFIIFKLEINSFWQEVHSEIFGVGVALIVIGLVWWVLGVKLE